MNYTCRRCQSSVEFVLRHLPKDRPTGVKGMIYMFDKEAYERGLCRACLSAKRQEVQHIMHLIDRYAQ